MTALADVSPRAENTEGSREERTPARRFQPGAIKQLFRDVAKAIIHDPPPEPEAERKRRREETRGGFIMAARRVVSVTRHVRQQFRKLAAIIRHTALPAYFFHDPGFNREERRAEAERVLRAQLEEWAQEPDSTEHEQQQTGFHYGTDAHFDLHI